MRVAKPPAPVPEDRPAVIDTAPPEYLPLLSTPPNTLTSPPEPPSEWPPVIEILPPAAAPEAFPASIITEPPCFDKPNPLEIDTSPPAAPEPPPSLTLPPSPSPEISPPRIATEPP